MDETLFKERAPRMSSIRRHPQALTPVARRGRGLSHTYSRPDVSIWKHFHAFEKCVFKSLMELDSINAVGFHAGSPINSRFANKADMEWSLSARFAFQV
ncbi:hypothetical protein [Paraburkholderia aromaticivorans]|uniref:hypothetical protein n=1 Tax=Paraburkholderia aromaticivorans TaxID=2026199 RepID=UPI0012FE1D3D|nr:hypothetical protein [Paraburkholderia aromaticivorans]